MFFTFFLPLYQFLLPDSYSCHPSLPFHVFNIRRDFIYHSTSHDKVEEYFTPFNDADTSTLTHLAMPQVEHQPSRRPIQLKDLQGCTQSKSDTEPGCLLLRNNMAADDLRPLWSWLGGFQGRRRQKKDASRRKKKKHSEGAEQRTSEILPAKTFTSVPNASTLEEVPGLAQSSPATHTYSSWTHPRTSKVSQHMNVIAHSPRHATLGKPVLNYMETKVAVPQRPVSVIPPKVLRRSIHLERTRSNNYRVPGEPTSPRVFRNRTRPSSQVTTFGDFISGKAISAQSPSSTKPSFSAQKTSVEPTLPRQAYRGTLWTSNVNIPETVSKSQFPETQIHHKECSICGTPNSPCTRYGEEGLWLCTSCRSPTSAIEVPPRIPSIAKPEHSRKRSKSTVEIDNSNTKNESELCDYCHISLSRVERADHSFCSWRCRQLDSPANTQRLTQYSPQLTLVRARRQQSVASINSQDAEEQWENFDSEMPPKTKPMTPLPKNSYNKPSRGNKHDHHGQEPANILSPTPPLKDSTYLSSKRFNSASQQSLIPFPPANDHPLHQSSHIREAQPLTPTPSTLKNLSPLTTPPPPIPPRPTPPKPRAQIANRTRKTSSVYPPTPLLTASDFPYLPPPIPEDHRVDIRRAVRASSVYTVETSSDDRPRRWPTQQDWELKSPVRDTGFYAYWETILVDEGGRTFRDV